jgi:hypothetical protein
MTYWREALGGTLVEAVRGEGGARGAATPDRRRQPAGARGRRQLPGLPPREASPAHAS